MDQFLMGLEGLTGFQDDIAIGGYDIQEHEQRLKKVFTIFQKFNLKTGVLASVVQIRDKIFSSSNQRK